MADICYYSVYIINTESATMMEMPDGDVECVMKIIVYNNAMIETPMEMTLMARAPGARVGGSGGGSAGAAAGGVIVVIIIILIIVAVIILWRKNMLPKFFNRGPPITRASDWGASAQNLGNVNYQYDHGEEGEVKAAKGQLPPHTTNDYSVMPTIKPKFDAGAALTVEEMEFPSSRIQLRELLHSGVYKANASSISGIPGTSSVLVKTLKDPNNRSQREMLLHELDIMLTIIPHDNVIRLLGCITTRGTPKPSIIMEFAQYDNLSQVLRRSRQSNPDRPDDVYGNLFEGSDTLTSQKLLLFSEQVASGMEHVSSLGIIHRKLGARNVFVGNNEICKIGSFSKAIQTDKREVKDKQETRLPIRWMAPESLSNHIFSFKTDVWSFGILLWEIVTLGALPYPGMKNKEITEKVAKGYRMEKPPHCTQELFTVMLRSWNKNIERRPGFGELVQEIRYINRQEEVVNLNQYDSELYGDINDM
ncbi:tyrosine kinase receptor Cad96Ca-like [Saccoglossus kowalevskii]